MNYCGPRSYQVIELTYTNLTLILKSVINKYIFSCVFQNNLEWLIIAKKYIIFSEIALIKTNFKKAVGLCTKSIICWGFCTTSELFRTNSWKYTRLLTRMCLVHTLDRCTSNLRLVFGLRLVQLLILIIYFTIIGIA